MLNILYARRIPASPKSADSTSLNGVNLIKRWEGLRLESYKPLKHDVWTIGYGTTRINGRPLEKGMKITRHQAQQYLIKDLRAFESAIRKAVTVDLTQNQFDALCSFTYNLGVGNLRKSTLLQKLNKGDFRGAAKEFPKWKYSGKKVIKGLLDRRKEEAAMFSLDIPAKSAKMKEEKIEICENLECTLCEDSQCQTKSKSLD